VGTSSGTPADPGRGFLLRLPLTLLIGMLAWLLLRPALDAAVPALAQGLIRAFEMPRVTRLVERDHWVEVRRSDFRAGSQIPTLPLTEVHFNLIVLLALQLALPRPLKRQQLERLLMGGAVLLLVHALNLTFEVKSLYATRLGEWSLASYSKAARNVWGFLQYSSDLPVRFSAPFAIWLAFNWDSVQRLLDPTDAERPRRAKQAGG
jgi:hypothetical protein